jgi:hypothetical protein
VSRRCHVPMQGTNQMRQVVCLSAELSSSPVRTAAGAVSTEFLRRAVHKPVAPLVGPSLLRLAIYSAYPAVILWFSSISSKLVVLRQAKESFKHPKQTTCLSSRKNRRQRCCCVPRDCWSHRCPALHLLRPKTQTARPMVQSTRWLLLV